MSLKRKHAPSLSTERGGPRHGVASDGGSGSSFDRVSGPVDHEYGQRGAFPGLQAGGADELFYAPADDGMQYLRMVRSEAQDVPKVLSSNARSGQGVSGGDGFYSDGAYIGAPEAEYASADGSSDAGSADDDEPVQLAYYRALTRRFAAFQAHVRHRPQGLETASVERGAALPLLPTAKAHQWARVLCHTAPPPLVGLAGVAREDVVRGLARLADVLEPREMLDPKRAANLGCWAWALLALCGDPGTIHSEDVSVIRGLGKRALAVAEDIWRKAGEGEMEVEGNGAKTEQEVVESRTNGHQQDLDDLSKKSGEERPREEEVRSEAKEGEIDEDKIPTGEVAPMEVDAADEAEELERRKQAMLAQIQEAEPASQESDGSASTTSHTKSADREEAVQKALMVLDIIVTIVGDIFGQRDLLAARIIW